MLLLFEHVFHVFFDAGVLGFDGFHPFRVFGFARRRQGTQFFACVVLYRPLAIHMQAQHKSALAIRQTQAAVGIHAKRRHHIVSNLLVRPLMPLLILGNGGTRQGADVIARGFHVQAGNQWQDRCIVTCRSGLYQCTQLLGFVGKIALITAESAIPFVRSHRTC